MQDPIQLAPSWILTTDHPASLIPRDQLAEIALAVGELVNQYGHPDDIPLGSLASKGIAPAVAEKCEALLTSRDFPEDAALAVAKWLRLIGEFSE